MPNPSERQAPQSSRSRSRRLHSPSARPGRFAQFMLAATDFGIVVTLLGVPLLLGGRIAIGQMTLAASVCGTALAWALHQLAAPEPRWTWTRAETWILAAFGLGLLQLVPLPAGAVAWLSPHIDEILPLWMSEDGSGLGLGRWAHLSLTTFATRAGLVTFSAYAILFFITVQRLQNLSDVERLLRLIGLASVGMALFGLTQWISSNHKFFWFYEYPYTTNWVVQGSFTNRNHFAHFLALGLGPLIWWMLKVLDAKPKMAATGFTDRHAATQHRELVFGLLVVAVGIVVFAALLSLSRGGALAMAVASLVCLSVLFRRQYISGKLIAALAGTGVLLGGLLFIYGYERVSTRLEDFELRGRLLIWEANLATIRDFPLFGTGIGSHVYAYKRHLDQPFDRNEYTHAENSYLQVASETGLIGLALALIAVGICLAWCLRGIRNSTSKSTTIALAAVLGSLAAHFVHAFFDFLWYIPGCMVIVVVLAAAACRLYQLSRESRISNGPPPWTTTGRSVRPAWIMAAAAVVAGAGWMIPQRLPALAAEPHWHSYVSLSLAGGDENLDEGNADKDREVFRQKLLELTAAAEADDDDPRFHLRLAIAYVSLFHILQKDSENPMTLAQIRDAALSAGFESQAAMDEWLGRALGDNRKYLDAALRHSRRAVELCPLEGAAYVYLADLAFLSPGAKGDPEGARFSSPTALPGIELPASLRNRCIEQALAVRPYEASVLFAAGEQAWLTGDSEKGLAYWQAAFHRNVVYQERIITILADFVPVSFFVKHFDPDWEALGRLKERFRETADPDEYAKLLRRFAEVSIERAREFRNSRSLLPWYLRHAQQAYDEIGEHEAAEKCLLAALKVDPNSFEARYNLGRWYFDQERYDEAAKHLAWCARRRPENYNVQSLAMSATKASLRGPELDTADRRANETTAPRGL